MRWLLYPLLVALLAALAGALAPALPSLALVPCVGLPIVVYLALRHPTAIVLVLTLAIGYLLDRATLAPTGFHAALLAPLAVAIRVAAASLQLETLPAAALLAFVGQGWVGLAGWLLLYGLTGRAGFASWAAAVQLPAMLASALVMLACWPLLRALEPRSRTTALHLLPTVTAGGGRRPRATDPELRIDRGWR